MAGATKGIAYLVKSPAEAPSEKLNPVIFLHAMLCSKEIWTDIPQRVADATLRTVYAIDAINHGESNETDPGEDFKFDRNVSDLFLFMAELGIKEAVLVGHDMGGITAIHAALDNPDKVEKVFIIDMHVKELEKELIERSKKFMDEWIKALEGIDKNVSAREVTKTVVPIVFAALKEYEKKERDLEEQAYMKAELLYKSKEGGGYMSSFHHENLSKALVNLKAHQKEYKGEFHKPAYFFHGESHYNVESEKESIDKHFKKAEMVKFEKASHFLFLDCPDEFLGRLVKYMKQ